MLITNVKHSWWAGFVCLCVIVHETRHSNCVCVCVCYNKQHCVDVMAGGKDRAYLQAVTLLT